MIITVTEHGEVGLRDPDDFRRFEIEVTQVTITVAEVMTALRSLGEVTEDGHVWVRETELAKLAGRAHDQAWLANVALMKDKVRGFGWVDDERQAIKAHIKWPAQDNNRIS